MLKRTYFPTKAKKTKIFSFPRPLLPQFLQLERKKIKITPQKTGRLYINQLYFHIFVFSSLPFQLVLFRLLFPRTIFFRARFYESASLRFSFKQILRKNIVLLLKIQLFFKRSGQEQGKSFHFKIRKKK